MTSPVGEGEGYLVGELVSSANGVVSGDNVSFPGKVGTDVIGEGVSVVNDGVSLLPSTVVGRVVLGVNGLESEVVGDGVAIGECIDAEVDGDWLGNEFGSPMLNNVVSFDPNLSPLAISDPYEVTL